MVFEYGACPRSRPVGLPGLKRARLWKRSVRAIPRCGGTACPGFEGRARPTTTVRVATSEIALRRHESVPGAGRDVHHAGAGGAAGLIDGRGWELVSPADKEGANIQGPGEPWGVTQAAADGERDDLSDEHPDRSGPSRGTPTPSRCCPRVARVVAGPRWISPRRILARSAAA